MTWKARRTGVDADLLVELTRPATDLVGSSRPGGGSGGWAEMGAALAAFAEASGGAEVKEVRVGYDAASRAPYFMFSSPTPDGSTAWWRVTTERRFNGEEKLDVAPLAVGGSGMLLVADPICLVPPSEWNRAMAKFRQKGVDAEYDSSTDADRKRAMWEILSKRHGEELLTRHGILLGGLPMGEEMIVVAEDRSFSVAPKSAFAQIWRHPRLNRESPPAPAPPAPPPPLPREIKVPPEPKVKMIRVPQQIEVGGVGYVNRTRWAESIVGIRCRISPGRLARVGLADRIGIHVAGRLTFGMNLRTLAAAQGGWIDVAESGALISPSALVEARGSHGCEDLVAEIRISRRET